MKKIILTLWGLAALVGCSKSELPVNDDSNLTVELSGSIIDAGKTRGDGVITGTTPASTMQIDVFRADDNPYGTTYGSQVKGFLKTTQEITLSPIQHFLSGGTDSKFIGVYPAGGTYNSGDRTITFTTLDGAKDVMVSDFAVGDADGLTDNELEFAHLLTKIRVDLRASGLDENEDYDAGETEKVINSWGNVTSVAVKNKETGAKITLPSPDGTTPVSIEATGITPTDLLLTTIAGEEPDPKPLVDINASGDDVALFGYAMFLPSASGTGETLDLEITFADGRKKTVTTANDALEYKAGKGYKITVVFEGEVISSTVVELEGAFTDWIEEGSADQESTETVGTVTPQAYTNVADKLTNAYIVAPGATLKFTVARAYKYEDDAFTDDLRATDAAYSGKFEAAVLWADAAVIDGDITVVGTGKNAVVTLKTTATAGNAVVAIKKAETEDIVWSYHIWVTDYVPEAENTTNTQSGYIFMSRNLGAMAADLSTAAYGLYYQWGRKDPFPGVDNPGGVDNAITKEATDSDKGTIAATIAAPNKFLTATASSSYDWLYAARQDDLWGQGADKSVYDPCPSGWRVPGFTSLDDDGSPWKGFTKDNGAWSDDGGKGWDWSNADNLLSPKQYGAYPAAGLRNVTSGTLGSTGGFGSAWGSAVSGTNGCFHAFNSTVVAPSSYDSRALGYPVRCVRE